MEERPTCSNTKWLLAVSAVVLILATANVFQFYIANKNDKKIQSMVSSIDTLAADTKQQHQNKEDLAGIAAELDAYLTGLDTRILDNEANISSLLSLAKQQDELSLSLADKLESNRRVLEMLVEIAQKQQELDRLRNP